MWEAKVIAMGNEAAAADAAKQTQNIKSPQTGLTWWNFGHTQSSPFSAWNNNYT